MTAADDSIDTAANLRALAAVMDEARAKYDSSTDFTMGIEEEFAICDPQTLDLVPAFTQLETAAKESGLGTAVAGELLASEIEFRTGRCETWAAAREELTDVRARVADLAQREGYVLAASGTHPWADYREQVKIDTPYYRELVHRMQYVAHRNNTFGLHVHIGVRGADRAIAVADALRNYQPLLLALSASSPFLDGLDSGLASTRGMTFSRNFVRGNIAPEWGDWTGFESFVAFLAANGSIDSFGQMWWGIRPHAVHGTVELRCFDGQPDVRDTLAIAALSLGLVAWLCDQYDGGQLERPFPEALIDENVWRGIRHGTDADFIDLGSTAGPRPVRELLADIVARAREAGQRHELGIDEGLERITWRLEHGCSALRQRAIAESEGTLKAAYQAVVDATMTSAGTPA